MQIDKDFIDGLIKKDATYINKFIDLYGNYLYSIVFNVCGTKQDSEEATQDVLLKVLKNIEKFDYSSNIKTWMYTIAKRTAIDYKRKIRHSIDLENVFNLEADTSSSEALYKKDEKAMINAMLAELKESDRELVELYYLKEFSNAEIAELTGLSVSNIKVKLFRARQTLADNISKYSDHEI